VARNTSEPEARALFDAPGPHFGAMMTVTGTARLPQSQSGVGKEPIGILVATSDIPARFRLLEPGEETARDPVETLRILANALFAAFAFDTLQALYRALDRVYQLGVSLPDAPLNAFRAAIRDLPRTTEAERLVVQRVGQDLFRQALLAYWSGQCPLTGITNIELLRASHIGPRSSPPARRQRLAWRERRDGFRARCV
jgi:hypothetical protein